MLLPKILKNENFVKLWITQATSIISLNIVNYLLLINLFKETSSTIAVSLLWLSFSLPVLLAGPVASTIVDMVDKKKLLILTNLLQAILILLLIPTDNKLFMVYGIVFFYSLLNQFYLPAESASLPFLVKNDEFSEANGLFLISKQAGTLLGFGIAGVINKFLGLDLSLIMCSMLLLVAFASTIMLPEIKVYKNNNIEKSMADFFHRVAEGYGFIKNNKYIFYPVAMIVGIEIILTIIALNVPALTKDIFNIDIENAAIIVIVPVALGALIGSIIFPKILGKTIRKSILIEKSLLILPINLLFMTYILGFLESNFRMVLIPILALVAGLCFTAILIPSQTYLQEMTPANMMGRLFGNLWFVVTLASILPLIFSASITESLGVKMLLTIISVTLLFAYNYLKKHRADIIGNVLQKK